MNDKKINIERILDEEGKQRIVVDGKTFGWITKWYKSKKVNETGIKMFLAESVIYGKKSFETYKKAEDYILINNHVDGSL